ncbi:MAG: tRNA lysidine(34) synthetase TilS [Thiohalomonadaceae bacterium]
MHIAQYLRDFLDSLPASKRYVVGYSGGLDSQVLLHTLHSLNLHLAAVHIHHGLSPRADQWAEFCQAQCAALQVPCTVVRVSVPADGSGLEAAARTARYAALEQHLGADEILLTAHHQDDQAETLLLMLLRGAGVTGLASMPRWRPFARGLLARPLLDIPRAALHAYALQHGLAWVDDESNFDTSLKRNYLRHEILPRLIKSWPTALQTLARAAAHLAEADGLLAELAEMDIEQVRGSRPDTLSITGLQKLSAARRRNVLRHWLRQLALPLPDTSQLQRLEQDMFTTRADASPQVNWSGIETRRYRDDLYAMKPLPSAPEIELPWDLSKSLLLPDGRRLQAVPAIGEGLSLERLQDTHISVRFRRGGERCAPVGRGHSHELKKLFQESGVPPWERDRVPLIFVDDQLAQVVDYWICTAFAAKREEEGWCCRLIARADIASQGEKQDNCPGLFSSSP